MFSHAKSEVNLDSRSSAKSMSGKYVKEEGIERQAVAFYKFVAIPHVEEVRRIRNELEGLLLPLSCDGNIVIGKEGINGTVSVPKGHTVFLLNYLNSHRYFGNIAEPVQAQAENETNCKEEERAVLPKTDFTRLMTRISPPTRKKLFNRLKVKVKSEIVTLGRPSYPSQMSGTYVSPSNWNRLLQDPDIVVVDARNTYEIEIGTFRNAINPKIDSLRELPAWLQLMFSTVSLHDIGIDSGHQYKSHLQQFKSIAMFCTGGVRCEKATSYARSLGIFERVYQLEGGILAYLDDIRPEESLWEGECFVFDKRHAVRHRSEVSESYVACYACRRLLSFLDRQRHDFVEGSSCLYCVEKTTQNQKMSYGDRHRLMKSATILGHHHIFDNKLVKLQMRENEARLRLSNELDVSEEKAKS